MHLIDGLRWLKPYVLDHLNPSLCFVLTHVLHHLNPSLCFVGTHTTGHDSDGRQCATAARHDNRTRRTIDEDERDYDRRDAWLHLYR